MNDLFTAIQKPSVLFTGSQVQYEIELPAAYTQLILFISLRHNFV